MKKIVELDVQELDCLEMQRDFNGGGILLAAVGLYVVTNIVGSPKAHIKAFKDGWNAG